MCATHKIKRKCGFHHGQNDADGPKAAEMKDSTALPAFLDRLATAASEAIMPHFRASGAIVDDKGKTRFDPVTAGDRGAEEAMRRLINATYPGHGILG